VAGLSNILKFLFFSLALSFVSVASVKGDLVEMLLIGNAGQGLLPGNVNPPTDSTGSGGIGPEGIIFDTATNLLHINIFWGSENGFSDLSGEVTALHLHGPVDLPPGGWSQESNNLIINLGNSLNFDDSPSSGGLTDIYFFSNEEAGWLLDGRTYINVHTHQYELGEIRGYLIRADAVPEPAGASIVMCAIIAFFRIRRRPCGSEY